MKINPAIKKNTDPSMDAFSRLRVSTPITVFSSQANYDYDPLQWEAGNTGEGVAPTHSANTRLVELKTAAGSGTSWIQSYQYVLYQPGKSHLVFITGCFGAPVANAVVEVGYGDDDNGVFLRQNGDTSIQLVLRSKTTGEVVERVVNQRDWNLDNMLALAENDSPSVWAFDQTKNFIFVIDLQFLGMGRVRCYFDLDGYLVPIHEFNNANVLPGTYMQSACLPVRMQIEATGTAAEKTAYFKCSSVNSEGGTANDVRYHFATPDTALNVSSGVRTHAVSIRPKTSFNGITYRGQILADTIDIINTGNQNIFYEIVVGAEFSVDPTWASIGQYTGVEVGTGGTYSGLTNGYVIESGYIVASGSAKTTITANLNVKLALALSRAGLQRSMGTLSILLTGITGTSTARCSLSYYEVR